MIKTSEIMSIMEKNYPLSLAEPWDNPGLIFGDPDHEIKRIFVTLNVTADIILEAAQAGADMILSHHPILMSPVKKIRTDENTGYMIYLLGKYGISLYAAHTNADAAKDGLNSRFAKMLDISDIEILEETEKGCGIGRIGKVKSSLGEYIKYLEKTFNTKNIITMGIEEDDLIVKAGRTAAVNGGGGDYVEAAAQAGAKLFITGEMNYHADLLANDLNMKVIKLGHGVSEMPVVDMFSELFSGKRVEVLKYTEDIIYFAY